MTLKQVPAVASPPDRIRFSARWIALVAIILLGFALRMHDLEGQSMWSDEGLSLYRATLDVPAILANSIEIDGVVTRDTNPAFYFLLLHLFGLTIGESVFALRFASVAAATLSIPLIYGLASTALGRRVGLVAALLMAISPFHVWQSQIMRNYGLLITLNLFSVYGLARFVLAEPGKRQARWLILWLAAGLLGIYTHFFAFFVFAFGLIVLGVTAVRGWGIRRLARRPWFWIILGVSLAILLPVTLLAIGRFTAGRQVDFAYVPFSKFMAQVFSALAVGVNWSLTHSWQHVLPVVVIALLGLVFSWRRRPGAVALLLGYQVVPLALLYGLSYINPIYNGVRHLLMGLPPFIVLVAAGIAGPAPGPANRDRQAAVSRAWRVVGPVLAAIVIVIQLAWLRSQFNAPELVRDDVRGPALYLSEHATADDVIVLHDTIIRPTFAYYYDGRAPVVSAPRLDESDVEATIERLRQIGDDTGRIWFLTEPTPRMGYGRTVLSDWAEANWLEIFDKRYASMWLPVHLVGYLSGQSLEAVPDGATPVSVSWNQTLDLHGTEIPRETTAGEPWWLTFYLSQPSDRPEQHTLSLRLVDEDGREWATMDQPIKTGFPPTADVADTMVRYDHQVVVPPGVPPGSYALRARLLRTADGATVPLVDGSAEVTLADVAVNGASCESATGRIAAAAGRDTAFNGMFQLVGHDLRTEEVRPGFPLEVDVWWCARRQPDGDYRLRLQLLDDAGSVVAESIGALSHDKYPTSQWQRDELLKGTARLVAPGNLAGGAYDVELSVLQPDADRPLRANWPLGPRSTPLGSIEVVPWPMETALPPVQHVLQAQLGQPTVVELHGYDLSSERLAGGELLEVVLVWRSVAPAIETSYKSFVHLVDESGEIVAQSDTVPAGGFRPTTSWRAGEVLSDAHTLPLPAELKPGDYSIYVGLYDPASGIRLPVFVDGQEQADGRLGLKDVTSQP